MAESANWMDMEGAQNSGGLNVQFYRGTKRDVFNSTLQGLPLDVGIDYVKVSNAGEKDNVIHEVNELHKRRWPEQWRAYQEGRAQIADGTPMDMLFPGNPEIVSTLKANNVHTIEQLADYPDSSLTAFTPTWKAKAQQFLKGKVDNRFPELEARAKQAETELAEMKAMVQQLMAAQQANTAPINVDQVEVANIVPVEPEQPRRGPGRPPKPQED